MNLARHPDLNRTIVHVVPSDLGAYHDVYRSLCSLSSRRPWTKVLSIEDRFDEYLLDPDVVLILWDAHAYKDVSAWRDRKCLLTTVFVEAMDPDEANLLDLHRAMWMGFRANAHHFDLIFTHTPWMAQMLLSRTARPTSVLPLGWDANAMGRPDWDRVKTDTILYYGNDTSRRVIFEGLFQKTLGTHFRRVRDTYGRALLDQLQSSYASIYVAHSKVQSFSTWRLWQNASTSAALIAERGDTWPFEPGKHYIELPRLTAENALQVAEDLKRLLDRPELLRQIAEAAHELAQTFTVDHVEDAYLVPALRNRFL